MPSHEEKLQLQSHEQETDLDEKFDSVQHILSLEQNHLGKR